MAAVSPRRRNESDVSCSRRCEALKGGQVVWVCAFVLLIAACQHASTSSARASAAAVVAVTSGRPTVRLSPVAIAMSDPAPGANPGVRAHLLTAVYCGGYLGSTRDPSQLARYVDWCANPSQKNVAAARAAGHAAGDHQHCGGSEPKRDGGSHQAPSDFVNPC